MVKVLLHGVTGPLDGTTYPDAMISMGMQSDEWIAAIGSYVRNAFGNRVGVDPAGRRGAAACGDRVAEDTLELRGAGRVRSARGAPESWKLAASHNTQTASDATTLRPWSSGHPQAPGMWLQIELPQPAMVTGVLFESPQALVDTTPAVPGAPTRTGIGRGGGPAPQPAFPRGYEVVVSTDGTTWSNPARARTGQGRRQRDRVHADAREVRAHPPDGQRRQRALDDQASADPGSSRSCRHGTLSSDVNSRTSKLPIPRKVQQVEENCLGSSGVGESATLTALHH